ncbi:MAG: hypothetical protein OEW22_02295 [Rubrivivax sp.]|nr:hypothetical protein [Rubrivivax sp.]
MRLSAGLVAGLLAGCAGLAADPSLARADPAEFADWSCSRIRDETDAVHYRAASLNWQVDRRAGRHIVELGLGLRVFWPALQALLPEGPDGRALTRMEGRSDALQVAGRQQGCPAADEDAANERLAGLPVRPGERLVYEEQRGVRGPLVELALDVVALRRNEIEFLRESGGARSVWRQDMAGNVTEGPDGALVWPALLRQPLALGDVVAGDLLVNGEPDRRARVRGQVVAVGPLRVAGRAFDAAVIELFGDVPLGQSSTRLDGSLVIERAAGLLLRLDLQSAQPDFSLQRRLVRVQPPH